METHKKRIMMHKVVGTKFCPKFEVYLTETSREMSIGPEKLQKVQNKHMLAQKSFSTKFASFELRLIDVSEIWVGNVI